MPSVRPVNTSRPLSLQVKDTSTGRTLAVKALSLRSMSGWKQLDLFEREAKTLQGLSHPGIPAYVDYFETDLQQDKGFFLAQARRQHQHLLHSGRDRSCQAVFACGHAVASRSAAVQLALLSDRIAGSALCRAALLQTST